LYPAGSKGREAIVGVFVNRLEQKPKLVARLHPASNQFHREIINAIMSHPDLTPELRGKLLENPEITAVLL
jgi:hypothetical protein